MIIEKLMKQADFTDVEKSIAAYLMKNGFDVKKNFEKAMEYIGGIVENPDMYGYMSAVDNLKLFAKIRNIN